MGYYPAGSVHQDAEYIFRVDSDSNANKKYVINITPGDIPECNCMAYAMKRNKDKVNRPPKGWCKHLDYVQAFCADATRKQKKQEAAEQAKVAEEFEKIRTVESLRADIRELEEL